jgi:hypothetical protein
MTDDEEEEEDLPEIIAALVKNLPVEKQIRILDYVWLMHEVPAPGQDEKDGSTPR